MQPPPIEEIPSTTNGLCVEAEICAAISDQGGIRARLPCSARLAIQPFPRPADGSARLLGRSPPNMVAAADRSFERQYRENIIIDQSRKFPQLRQGQRAQVPAALGCEAHRLRYGFMRFPKRCALFYQIIGEIGSR